MFEGGEEPHLVEGIRNLSLAHLRDLDALQRVRAVVALAHNLFQGDGVSGATNSSPRANQAERTLYTVANEPEPSFSSTRKSFSDMVVEVLLMSAGCGN